MAKHVPPPTGQLRFDGLLAEAEAANRAASLQRATGHLPETMDEAIPFFRGLIVKHHAAMLAGDIDGALELRAEATRLALRLNGGKPGIIAGPDAPGCVLARATAVSEGSIPLWGQEGCFILDIDGMAARIRMDGVFGIGARYCPWMNFFAEAIDRAKPFISETGYHSFMGLQAALLPGITPDALAREVIRVEIKRLKGKLVKVG